MSDTKEILGYLARWTVLGLVVLVGVGICGIAVKAAGEAVPETGGHLAFGDVLWLHPQPIYMMCYGQASPPVRGDDEQLICQGPDGQMSVGRLARTTQEDIHATLIQVRDPADGINRLRLIGIPYSRRAFQSTDVVAWVGRPDRPVWFVDESTFADSIRRRDDDVSELIELLGESGPAVWLFSGEPGAFVTTRRALRAIRAEMPLIYADLSQTIRRHPLKVLLRRSGANGTDACLLTDRLHLAGDAAGIGMTVHWISPGAGESPARGVVRHTSLAKFKESLAH